MWSAMNLDNHPCFNPDACKSFGRVHLPVAPRCNIQCRFCNRKFDCVNETRPGVTSAVLSPGQAMVYLEEVFAQRATFPWWALPAQGIPLPILRKPWRPCPGCGPGTRTSFLCVATNGLNLRPYIDDVWRD
jgi:nitrogen fixation protein NifB